MQKTIDGMLAIFDALYPASSFTLSIRERNSGTPGDKWLVSIDGGSELFSGTGNTVERALIVVEQAFRQYANERLANRQAELDTFRKAIES